MRELSLPLYALFQLPAKRIEIREVRIALEILLDLCYVHRICIGQELAVHMLAADHEALSCGQCRKQLLDIVEEKDALRRFVPPPSRGRRKNPNEKQQTIRNTKAACQSMTLFACLNLRLSVYDFCHQPNPY